MENAFLQKQIIRHNIRNTVKQLKFIEQKYAADSITNLIINYLNLHSNYQNIACYWPTKYEINTVSLIKFLLDNNKSCYLPIINNKNSTLNFIKYDNSTKLIKNKFGILEPTFTLEYAISIEYLDIIFMPLVAFDKLGNRIGSGAGFYDRSLANKHKYSCKLIGLAYSIQQVESCEPDPWDINLDHVITESQWFDF